MVMTMNSMPGGSDTASDNSCPDEPHGWYELSTEGTVSTRQNGNFRSVFARSSSARMVCEASGDVISPEEQGGDASSEEGQPRSMRSFLLTGSNSASSKSKSAKELRSLRRNRSAGDLPENAMKKQSSMRRGKKTKRNSTSTQANAVFSKDAILKAPDSPGRLLLGRLFAHSGSNSKLEPATSQAEELEEKHAEEMRLLQEENLKRINDLQSQNEKLTKESKRLKKQLAKERKKASAAAAANASALTPEELETTQHFAAAMQPSRSLALEQAELQLDCYEKIIEEKNRNLANLKQKSFDQEKRIAYLEVLCLQNGVEIGNAGSIVTQLMQKAASANAAGAPAPTTLGRSASAPISRHTIASPTTTIRHNVPADAAENSCTSFFGDSFNPIGGGSDSFNLTGSAVQEEEEDTTRDGDVWEEDLKGSPHHRQHHSHDSFDSKSDLESALKKLPGPSVQQKESSSGGASVSASKASANASMALDDLTMSSIFNAKKKESNSWLGLEVDPFGLAGPSFGKSSNDDLCFFQHVPEEEEPVTGHESLEELVSHAVEVNKNVASDAAACDEGETEDTSSSSSGPKRVDASGNISPCNLPSSTTGTQHSRSRLLGRRANKKKGNSTSDEGSIPLLDHVLKSPRGVLSPFKRPSARKSNSPKRGNSSSNVEDMVNALEKSIGAFDTSEIPIPPQRLSL